MSSPATLPDAGNDARGRLVVRMVSGRLVDLGDPDPASIRIQDLAHALARIYRFTGNVTGWWSVADHALLCRELICDAGAPELALAALHHDSHEAITGNLITPVRELLDPDCVHALTWQLDAAIAAALGFDAALLRHPLVLELDRHRRAPRSPRPAGHHQPPARHRPQPVLRHAHPARRRTRPRRPTVHRHRPAPAQPRGRAAMSVPLPPEVLERDLPPNGAGDDEEAPGLPTATPYEQPHHPPPGGTDRSHPPPHLLSSTSGSLG